MYKEVLSDVEIDDNVLEDAARGLPQDLFDEAASGTLRKEALQRKISLTVRKWKDGERVNFEARLGDDLGEVLQKGARALGERVLPPGNTTPLDLLRARKHSGEWSRPIQDLTLPLWVALLKKYDRRFAIEYVLAVKINATWGISPKEQITPRELLAAFGMDANEFTLYAVDSDQPLPVDTPMAVKRGQKFEAQKDGRYGDINCPAKKPRGTQTVEDDIQEAGGSARLLSHAGQQYAAVKIDISSPPWSEATAEILFAIPATYPTGGLDAFYVKLPLGHSSGDIPKKQSEIIVDGERWLLISWHYLEAKPWNSLHDDLATHVQHCRGFFLTRGVKG